MRTGTPPATAHKDVDTFKRGDQKTMAATLGVLAMFSMAGTTRCSVTNNKRSCFITNGQFLWWGCDGLDQKPIEDTVPARLDRVGHDSPAAVRQSKAVFEAVLQHAIFVARVLIKPRGRLNCSGVLS
jgi:hypothetical protein